MPDNHDDSAQDPNHVRDIAFDLNADKINKAETVRPKRDGTPASPYYKADNAGGFGNPPVKSQFKNGNKGGGRKKKDESMEAALRREFTGKVTVKREGKTEKVSIAQVLARRKRDRGLKGSDRALDAAIELAKRYGPQEQDPLAADWSWATEDEITLIVSFLNAALRTSDDEGGVDEMRRSLRESVGLYRLAEGPDGLPRFTRICDEDDR